MRASHKSRNHRLCRRQNRGMALTTKAILLAAAVDSCSGSRFRPLMEQLIPITVSSYNILILVGTVHQNHAHRQALHPISDVAAEYAIPVARIQLPRRRAANQGCFGARTGSRRFASICWAESSRIMPNMKKRYDAGIAPARRTPLRAPAVVAVSSTIASRTFVKRPFRKGAALPV